MWREHNAKELKKVISLRETRNFLEVKFKNNGVMP
jgi:hypothetical protein